MKKSKALITARKSGRRGSVLVMVIIFSALSAFIVGSSLRLSAHHARMGHRTHLYNAALNVAEAGAERGLYQLSQSAQAYDISETVVDNGDATVGDFNLSVSSAGVADEWYIDSVGFVPSEVEGMISRGVRLHVTAAGTGTSLFEWALFSNDDVYLDRSVRIDSYDSEAGPHPYAVTNEGPFAPNGPGDSVDGLSGTDGNLGGTLNADFTLDDEVLVGGSLQTGGSITIGDSTVTGDTLPNDDTAKLPAPYPEGEHDAAALNNNNDAIQFYNSGDPFDLDGDGSLGELVHSGVGSGANLGDEEMGGEAYDVIVIPPGDYHFSSLMNEHDIAIRVIPDGVVNIYLDPGSADASAILTDQRLVINENTENPHNFNLFVKQGLINFDKHMTMYGTLYAPNSFVYVDQDIEVFGAMVAGGAEFDAAVHLHYDTSLGGAGGGGNTVTVISWTEITPP